MVRLGMLLLPRGIRGGIEVSHEEGNGRPRGDMEKKTAGGGERSAVGRKAEAETEVWTEIS